MSYRLVDKTWLRDQLQAGSKDIAIVDVRDGDFPGGHLPGAINIPAHELNAPELVQRLEAFPKVVFHCALSRPLPDVSPARLTSDEEQRGPRAALQYARAKAALAPQDTSPNVVESPAVSSSEAAGRVEGAQEAKPAQEVLVLEGGATEWIQAYRDDPALVADYDAKVWG